MAKFILLAFLIGYNPLCSSEIAVNNDCEIEKIVSYLVEHKIVTTWCSVKPDTIKVNFSHYGYTMVSKYYYIDGELNKTDVDFECLRYKYGHRTKCLFLQVGDRTDSNDIHFVHFCAGSVSGVLYVEDKNEIVRHSYGGYED